MQLTSFTDYSIRTLMYLAAHSQDISSVGKISEYYGISRNHLVKVVHQLAQFGYIETSKGRGGGIKISEGATTLKLGDLIARLEPNMDMVECFDSKTNTCRITDSCQLKHYLHEATRAYIDALNQYTLADTIMNKEILFS